MKAFRWCVLAAVMLAVLPLRAACTWPAWEQFKKDYISEGGRVVDPSDTRKITTSEGQSYALFFALAANGSQTGEGNNQGAGSAGPRKTSKPRLRQLNG